jgi:hypothetical protein
MYIGCIVDMYIVHAVHEVFADGSWWSKSQRPGYSAWNLETGQDFTNNKNNDHTHTHHVYQYFGGAM